MLKKKKSQSTKVLVNDFILIFYCRILYQIYIQWVMIYHAYILNDICANLIHSSNGKLSESYTISDL